MTTCMLQQNMSIHVLPMHFCGLHFVRNRVETFCIDYLSTATIIELMFLE